MVGRRPDKKSGQSSRTCRGRPHTITRSELAPLCRSYVLLLPELMGPPENGAPFLSSGAASVVHLGAPRDLVRRWAQLWRRPPAVKFESAAALSITTNDHEMITIAIRDGNRG